MTQRHKRNTRCPELGLSSPASLAARRLLPAMFRTAATAAGTWLKSEDPEALHDLRVAARRHRAALRFFKPLLKRRAVRRVLKAMDNMATVSGPVRDTDMLAGFCRNVRGAADDGKLGRARLRRFLAGEGFRSLRRGVAEVHRGALVAQSHRMGPRFGAFAVARLRNRLRSLEGCDLLTLLNNPNRIHVARKRIRRLRYWAEMVAPYCDSRMAMLATRLHDAATALGELHDVDVAIERRGSDPRLLKRLRRGRARKVRSAWRALTTREGHLLIRDAMVSTGTQKAL